MAFRVRGNGKWSELDEEKASKEGRIGKEESTLSLL
jgi:hypothetical protein